MTVRDWWYTLTCRGLWEYALEPRRGNASRLATMLCRLRGHPAGVGWYNSMGTEPNMHCRTCGDDLG